MPPRPLLLWVPRRRRQRRVERHRQWTLPATGLDVAEKGEEDDRGEDSRDRIVRTREALRSMQESERGESRRGQLAPVPMGAKLNGTGNFHPLTPPG